MSGLGLFVKGLNEGLPVGIDLAREFDRQGDVRATQKAGDLLAQMNALDPFAATDDAAQQGLAEPGQQPQTNPNRGFSGTEFKSLSDQYFDAISGMSDIQQWGMARQAFGEMRMEKINSYLDAGIQAYDAGDTGTATRMLRGASAFMNPGVTPEIAVDPNTGAFLVANYDKDDNPVGGFAVTRDQLMDLRGRNTDFNAWASRDQREQEHKAQMALNWSRFNASQKRANAAAAASGGRTAKLNELTDAQIAESKARTEGLTLENEVAAATQESDISTTISTSYSDANKARADAEKAAEDAAKIRRENIAAETSFESGMAKTEAENAKAIAEAKKAEQEAEDAELNQFRTDVSAGLDNASQFVEPPPEAGATEAVDIMSQQLTGDKDQKTMPDPWYYQRDSDGRMRPRVEMDMIRSSMTDDLFANNPNIAPEAAVGVIDGTIGRSQITDFDQNPESGDWFAITPAGKFKVSEDIKNVGLAFKKENYEDLLAMQQDEAGKQRVIEQNTWWQQPEEAPVQEGVPTEPGAFSEPMPDMPPMPDMAHQPVTSAVPAPAAIPAPAVDDTATGVAPSASATGVPQYGQAIDKVPALSQAITAWVQTGMPPDGQEVANVNAILRQLDPVTRNRVFDEISALRQQQ